MVKNFAVARLRTKDGNKYFLQRRNTKTDLFPGSLSFFGGRVEDGETPEDCLRRELEEETSLDVGELALDHLTSMTVLPPHTLENNPVEVHVFDALIHDSGFEVKEGARVELHTLEEALAQPDLVPTTRHILENIEEN